jgi:hypothetical protein
MWGEYDELVTRPTWRWREYSSITRQDVPALGVKNGQSRSDLARERVEIELFSQLAVVALESLFELNEVSLEAPS